MMHAACSVHVFRQSYDVEIELDIPGTSAKSCNTLDLKNPFFRYTGAAPQPPPGNTGSATEQYWNSLSGRLAPDAVRIGFILLKPIFCWWLWWWWCTFTTVWAMKAGVQLQEHQTFLCNFGK